MCWEDYVPHGQMNKFTLRRGQQLLRSAASCQERTTRGQLFRPKCNGQAEKHGKLTTEGIGPSGRAERKQKEKVWREFVDCVNGRQEREQKLIICKKPTATAIQFAALQQGMRWSSSAPETFVVSTPTVATKISASFIHRGRGLREHDCTQR
ncbi:hypothetical protein B0H13DRAFT_1865178 [Mycena leptocephala]|nr:hypothetical protein B0H13DRAFT_1865178 [Mycena leptocephala]